MSTDKIWLTTRSIGETDEDMQARQDQKIKDTVWKSLSQYNQNLGRNSDSPYGSNQLIGMEGEDKDFATELALNTTLELLMQTFRSLLKQQGLTEVENISLRVSGENQTNFSMSNVNNENKNYYLIYMPQSLVYNTLSVISSVIGRIYSNTKNMGVLKDLAQEKRRELVTSSVNTLLTTDFSDSKDYGVVLLPFSVTNLALYTLLYRYYDYYRDLVRGLSHEIDHIKQAILTPDVFEDTAEHTREHREAAKGKGADYFKAWGNYANDAGEQSSRKAEKAALQIIEANLSSSIENTEAFAGEGLDEILKARKMILEDISSEVNNISE